MTSLKTTDTKSGLKVIKSTHGKALLRELSSSDADINLVLDYINKDPYAGKLKNPETKENAFHLLLSGRFNHTFVLKVLSLLIEKCPKGLEDTNNVGALPLHVALCQSDVCVRAVMMILDSYPGGARVQSIDYGLIPLFLSVMRDDASYPIVKKLCDLYPDGAKHKNRTHSYPLHFACKRLHPNKQIISLLINLYPEALLAINGYGWHPLHCLTSTSDDVTAIQLVHEANPEAIKIQDRQGRTCLHLAVMLIGKDHESAVAREEESMKFEREQEMIMMNNNSGNSGSNSGNGVSNSERKQQQQLQQAMNSNNNKQDNNSDDEEEDYNNEENPTSSSSSAYIDDTIEYGNKSRQIIYYLISVYPQALLIQNNFQATPVETVMEKARKTQSKFKKVSVWGLYDDPVTTRLLLSFQRRLSRKQIVSGLRPSHLKVLFDLNWHARKYALLASYGGCVPPHIVQACSSSNSSSSSNVNNDKSANNSNKSNKHINKHSQKNKSASTKNNNNNNNNNTNNNNKNTNKGSNSSSSIDKNNILARLREYGLEDCIKQIISWI